MIRAKEQTYFRTATSSDVGQIRRLLDAAKLPSADIEKHLRHFVVASTDGGIAGAVGLEVYGEYALLRSLVVRESARGMGIGVGLFREIIDYARSLGIKEVALLTTTAEPFFAKRGFEKIGRDQAPEFVRQTEEFKTYCSSEAVVMRKGLTSRDS